MSSKRYYWLKLNSNFFEDDTIEWIEEQENGTEYLIFYLKLCLRSLQDEGELIRYVGERLMPYDIKALAKLTKTSTDTVAVAMKAFEEIGLIERLDTGAIYMKQINEMIGSETHSAVQKRRQRARNENQQKLTGHCPDNVLECPPYIDIETEIETEIDLELDIEKDTKKNSVVVIPASEIAKIGDFYQQNIGMISPNTADHLRDSYELFGFDMVMHALTITVDKQATYGYTKGIFQRWLKNNIKTMADVKAAEEAHKRKSQQAPFRKQKRVVEEPEWINNSEPVVEVVATPESIEKEKQIREKMARMFGDANEKA